MRWAVAGAGISGLASAFELVEGGHEVTVFESGRRAGGNIETEREGGYVVEWGPNGFLDNVPATLDLVRRLGLEEELLVSSEAARKRFLWRGGRLHRLPESPPAFLRSPLLSPAGRARVLLEPLARGRPRHDETVHAFASRRIGREAADVLVQAMVSGVYAGDARRLSLRSTFPKMFEMERAHGSLFRALMAKRRAGAGGGGPAGPGGTLTSFRGGMATLIESLVVRLGDRVRLAAPAGEILSEGGGYRLAGGEGTFDRVLLACPARRAADLLEGLAPAAAEPLREIRGAPISVVATAFDEAEIGGPPDGFGFLAPPGQGLRILGCLWTSSIYPGERAPEGRVLLRTMVGGARDPEAAELADEALLGVVAKDLARAMDLRAEPLRHWVFRYPRGIPQYEVGHGERLRRALDSLRAHPGIRLAGNSYRGISVNAVVEEASALRGV